MQSACLEVSHNCPAHATDLGDVEECFVGA